MAPVAARRGQLCTLVRVSPFIACFTAWLARPGARFVSSLLGPTAKLDRGTSARPAHRHTLPAGYRAALQDNLLGLAALTLVCALTSRAAADAEQCLKAHEAAQEHRLRGHYVEARAELLVCVQGDCPRLVSRDCASWLGEVEASLPTVVFAVDDSKGGNLIDVRITKDGKLLTDKADGRALPLDPGVSKLRFEADGYAPSEQTLSIRESEKGRLVRIALEPLPEGSGQRVASTSRDNFPGTPADVRKRRLLRTTYALAGVSTVSLAMGVIYGVAGKRRYDNLDESCGRDCSQRSIDDGKLRYVIADVAFGVAGAAAVGAVTSYLFARRLADRSSALGVASDGKSTRLVWQGRF